MAFSYSTSKIENKLQSEASIDSISESLGENRNQTVKSNTIKTEIKTTVITTQEVESDYTNDFTSQVSNEYTETFETDEDDDDETTDDDSSSQVKSVSWRSRSKRSRLKRQQSNADSYVSEDVIHEESEDAASQKYSDTFEQITSSEKSSKKSKSSSTRTSNSESRSSKRTSSETSKSKSLENTYSDTFVSPTSSSSEYETQLSEGRMLSIDELTKRLKKKLKMKEKRDKEAPADKVIYSNNTIENIIQKIKNGRKLAQNTDVTNAKRYDKLSKVEIKEELMQHLKMQKYLHEIEDLFNKKINSFGQNLADELFPEQYNEEITEMNRNMYYKYKCDLIKFKQIANKIEYHEEHYVDSINLIGELASSLPRPTTAPDIIWSMLLKPLNDAKNSNH